MIFPRHKLAALALAAQLSALSNPAAAAPAYAPVPNDDYWGELWYLENRTAEGNRQGADMNARAAWAQSTGEGIVIAIVDNGVELSHPDLAPSAHPTLY